MLDKKTAALTAHWGRFFFAVTAHWGRFFLAAHWGRFFLAVTSRTLHIVQTLGRLTAPMKKTIPGSCYILSSASIIFFTALSKSDSIGCVLLKISYSPYALSSACLLDISILPFPRPWCLSLMLFQKPLQHIVLKDKRCGNVLLLRDVPYDCFQLHGILHNSTSR